MAQAPNLYAGYLTHRLGINAKQLSTHDPIGGYPVFGDIGEMQGILKTSDYQKYAAGRLA